MNTVAAVVSQGLLTFDFAIACEVFGLDRSDIVDPWYDFVVVSADPPPLRTSTGFLVDGIEPLAAAESADTVIVPGWADPNAEPGPELSALLRRRHAEGARIVSFCTGTFALAAAGLLEKRRATTHWMYADDLRRRYPTIDLDPSVLFVEDENVFTAAGTAAGMDLSLHLVARDFGQSVANAVCRRVVLPPLRQGGQAQYIEHALPRDSDGLGPLLEWIDGNLDRALDVGMLAERAHLSVRSLNRRFDAELGMPPKRWIATRRAVRARELLETTRLPVAVVATRCGFPSTASLRSTFARMFMTTPHAYRSTFRET